MIAQSLFTFEQSPIARPSCERSDTGLRPAAAKADPLSSKIAADQIERDGTRRHQIEATVAVVRLHPYCTSVELSNRTGLDRYLLARRLPDAEKLGLVVRSDKLKRCDVSGKLALTWRVNKPGERPETRSEDV